ncbi:MAG: efflux transporter outer membrane subunit [Pseudomonadota bacterium]
MKHILALGAVLALSACDAVGPNFMRPQAPLADRFAFAHAPELLDVAQEQWWTHLGDPLLNQFMAEGLSSNLSLKVARARIAESEALLRAEGVSSQISGDLTGRGTGVLRSDGSTNSSSSATLTGRYVFDLFGGVTRSRERALANLNASIFDTAQTRLAYQADLAGAMIQARFFQDATRITEQTIQSRRRILGLTSEMRALGQATRNDQVRARAELAQAQADLPGLRNGVRSNAIRVAVLLDQPVAHVLARISGASHQLRPTVHFGAGVPANLVRNRPDILAAEQRLAGAYANLGVAEADLYPSLTLDGTLNAATEGTFTIGPILSVPVLSRGRLVPLRDAARTRVDQAELTWRNTVRQAVGDVEGALVEIDTARQEIDALGVALGNFRTLATLSRETFQIGSTTLLALLDTDEDVRRIELQRAGAWRDLAQGLARLAVATGRGHAVELDPAPPSIITLRPKPTSRDLSDDTLILGATY